MSILGNLGRKALSKVKSSRKLAAIKHGIAVLTSDDDESQNKLSSSFKKDAPVQAEPEKFSFGDARKPAQVFGARSCPWSGRALRVFESAGVKATYMDLDLDGSSAIREELRVETGQLSVPYVFLRGQFIGGFNALDEVQRLGQLEYLVLPKAEREAHPNHGKIEIAARVRLAPVHHAQGAKKSHLHQSS